MTTITFDELKNTVFKDYMGWDGVQTIPEQIISTVFTKLYSKDQLQNLDPQQLAALRLKQKLKIDPKDREWMKDPLRM